MATNPNVPPHTESSDRKATLRRWAKARRATLNLPALSEILTERLMALPEMRAASDRALYLAGAGEVNIEGAIDVQAIARWYAPRCLPGRELAFYRYIPGVTPVTAGAFGIREPVADAGGFLMPEEIDLIVIPALSLTPDGARLGYGGGYYDRFLPKLRPDCVTVGVLPDALIVPELPQAAWDIRLKIILTEKNCWRVGN